MYDQQDLTDFLDMVFEYNDYPEIMDIRNELGFSNYKIQQILSLLQSLNIIENRDGTIIPIMDYYDAIVLLESIAD